MHFLQLTYFGLISFAVCHVTGVPVADNTDYNQYSDDQAYDYNYDDSEPEYPEKEEKIVDPVIKSKPKKMAVEEGTTINLPCLMNELTGNIVLWFKDSVSNQIAVGNSIVNGDSRATVTSVDKGKDSGSVLLIGVAAPEDEGTYVCQIQNAKKTEVRHHVTIVTPPSVAISSPGNEDVISSLSSSDILTAKKGDDVTLTCTGEGTPTPTISWTRLGGKKMPDGSDSRSKPEIMYTSVTRKHEGIYKCTAENDLGNKASKTIKVVVEYEPEIEVEEVLIHSQTGDSVELVCNVHAVPKPTIVWRKNNDIIKAENHANIEIKHNGHKHTLSIENVKKEDYGNYHCEAKNSLGSAKRKLEISGKAKAAKFSSDPAGKEVDTFNLEWSAKSFNPITEFELQYRTGQEGSWTKLTITPDESKHPYHKSGKHYFTKLQGATNYQARVMSKNSEGWSKPSPIFAFATKGAAPIAAKTVSDDSAGSGSSLYSSLLTVIFAVILSLSIRQN